ncbi:NFATC2-interacting protein-like [Ciona intestinalis]
MSSSEEEVLVTKCVKRKRRRMCSKDEIGKSVNLYSHRVAPTLYKSKQTALHIFQEEQKASHPTEHVTPTTVSDDSSDLSDDDVIAIERSPEKTIEPRCLTPPPVKHMPEIKGRKGNKMQKKGLKLLENVKSMLHEARHAQLDLDSSVDNNNSIVEYDDTNSYIVVRIRLHDTIHKYPVNRDDSFYEIFKLLAKKKSVAMECLVMTYNDQAVCMDDTAKKLGLSVADTIDCLIVHKKVGTTQYNSRDYISINFQCKFQKVKKNYKTNKYTSLQETFEKYAADIGHKLQELVFKFDGDVIHKTSLPLDLDLENDDTIDVMRKKIQTTK